ncbi:tripartite-type tricarboxylate transporter receptor subunit TctC [Variovorax boronicumulans]|uniref:tripartite tricarboxylate transporter substrate binding protein n=1 Tax=Variovorax boronicumulans TaxID=436515 RepID=UPI0027859388|nr:tripartite tricarboxylate transporter substrate binding protein [Variovorax boronicumulans]MDP9913522.1 tripartite-type tricarboxylate transporter receptor subunit TctC [Variovorax boronicumulans]
MTQQWPRRAAGLGLLALALGVASTSQASQPQAYPDRMIRLVVPFTAGGSSDVQARMLADRLGKLYKQSVVVDNKPGAGGHIGGKFVADAPADGYTLLLGSIGLHATYGVFKKLSYDPATDLKVVTVLAEMPHVVVANPALPANDLKQLVALARKQPDTINFGSAGVGSSVHMIGELFKLTANAPIVHVPYKGSTAALNDLLAGQIQLMFENPPTTLAHIRGGKLKALAVTGKTRLPALPEVPTAIESGFAAFEATSWTTVAVSAKVPDAIADKLNADIRRIVAAPEFRQGLSEQGMTPVANTRDAATRFIAAEKLRWDQVIQQGRIAAE